MDQPPLPMPSDLKQPAVNPSPEAAVEPPSVKLIVRLFVIPLFIVAAAVGIMFLIGRMAGGEPSLEQAVNDLRNPGGGRTGEWLVGPGAKQRYLDAKTLTDKMKQGMSEAERINLADQLIDILDNHVSPDEGEVQHFVLLALGRSWQVDPQQGPISSPAAIASREKTVRALLRYADAPQISTRKAALLACVYLAGQDEVAAALPVLRRKVTDNKEDLDVRLAAATALGPLSRSDDNATADALHTAMGDTDTHDVELVWASALSLAQMNHPEVADTILKLLSRDELSSVQVYDREIDPANPVFRNLGEAEQERILINTIEGAVNLDVPAVQEKLRDIALNDPSLRVRSGAMDTLKRHHKM